MLLLEANRAAGLGMVDRTLTQLLLSGSLDGVTGSAIGRFEGFEGYHDRGRTILDVPHEPRSPRRPILAGWHLVTVTTRRTIPLGVPCHLEASSGMLILTPALF